MGECIQGLVLLANQWLLFVELGGFVNNAFLCPRVRGCRQTSPLNFCLCVGFFVGVFIDQGQQAQPSYCVRCPSGPVFFFQAHGSISVYVCFEYTNYLVRACGKCRAVGVYC